MLVQFDDWWEKYLHQGRGMRGVSVLSVWDCRGVIKEVARLGLSWSCTADTPLNPPLGVSRAVYPTPSHHCSDSSPEPPHQSPGQLQLPDLAASSSASQQMPNNARPDNRLPCRLQVCQPRACQITVSVNSGGGRDGRGEIKEEGVKVDGKGVEKAGWSV